MKPSWKDAPEEYQWLCQDSDGLWWFTTHEPGPSESVWVGSVAAEWYFGGESTDATGWKETKEPRP